MFRFAEKNKLSLNSNSNNFNTNKSEKTIIEPIFIKDNSQELNNFTNETEMINDFNNVDNNVIEENKPVDKFSNVNILSPEVCEDLMKKYPYLDFGCNKIQNSVSFLQMQSKLRFYIIIFFNIILFIHNF